MIIKYLQQNYFKYKNRGQYDEENFAIFLN